MRKIISIITIIIVLISTLACSAAYSKNEISGDTLLSTYGEEEALALYHEKESVILPDFESCTLYSYNTSGFFQSEADTLIFRFDEGFEKAKEVIGNSYEFHSAPLKTGDDKPYFEVNGFSFRVRVIEKVYPKVIYFIGINDHTKEIAFVYFGNTNLDIVSDYEVLMNAECGWQYIE